MDPSDSRTIQVSVTRPLTEGGATHYLVGVEGERSAWRQELLASLTIGRDTSCRIRFQDPSLSKVHCRVRFDGQRVVVTDLGSTNGTFVNGRRIAGEAELHVEDLLQVGSQVLRHEFRARAEVERERELAQDLERARAYIAALLPAPLQSGPMRTDWCYVPSAVLGGDLFGYHALDAQHTALYLLDVCGHGVGAAMHSASVFNVLKNGTLPGVDFKRPEEVLARMNESFQMERHGGMFLTAWYGVVDARARSLEFSSAGHPPALLKAPDGELRGLQTRNPPIGVLEGRRFLCERAELERGSRLYLFSDGAFEIVDRDGREGTLEDFEQLVRQPGIPGTTESERLRAAVSRVHRERKFEDDFSLLVASFD